MLLFTLPSLGVWVCWLLSFLFGWETKKHLTLMREYSAGCMWLFGLLATVFFGSIALGVFIALYMMQTSLFSLVMDVLIIFLGIYGRGWYEKKHAVLY